ncbi:MAG: hypothetical protein OQK24_13435, partial [Magnetovibrio sp.]|nr:hypothetical protein [Magnetovibrio sp.]
LRDRLMNAPDGPFRVLYQNKPTATAVLDDIAAMAQVALELYQITFLERYLLDARAFVARTETFWDHTQGGYYLTPPSNVLPTPFKPRFDEPNPSANARMIEVLSTLALLTGNIQYAQRANQTLRAFGALADEPINYRPSAALLSSAFLAFDAVQIVLIAQPDDVAALNLIAEIHKTAVAARSLLRIEPGTNLPTGHPARYKEMVDGLPTAYVCRGTVCSLPITTPIKLAHTLHTMRGPAFAP